MSARSRCFAGVSVGVFAPSRWLVMLVSWAFTTFMPWIRGIRGREAFPIRRLLLDLANRRFFFFWSRDLAATSSTVGRCRGPG